MTSKQRIAFTIALLANFLAPFMTSAVNLSVNDISTYFQCAPAVSTWIINAYTLATAVFCIPIGALADARGHRNVMIAGAFGFTVAGVLCALAPSAYVLIAGRLLMGIACAGLSSAAMPLMLAQFEPGKQGRLIGFVMAAVSIGVALGPSIGGMINAAFGWRMVFVAPIVISVVMLVLCLKGTKREDVPQQSGRDIAGNFLYVFSVAMLMFGLGQLSGMKAAPYIIAVGFVLFIVFWMWERRHERPAISVRLFSTSASYTLASLGTLLNFAAMYPIIYSIAVHLQNIYGLSSATTGIIMMVQPVIQMVVAPIAGRLSERFNSNGLAGIGMVVVFIGLALLSRVSMTLPLWTVVVGLGLAGLGNAIFSSPNGNAIISSVGPEHRAEANATMHTMRGVGQCVSLAVVGFMYEMSLGKTVFSSAAPVDLAAANAQIMTMCAVAACLSAACCFIAAVIERRRSH